MTTLASGQLTRTDRRNPVATLADLMRIDVNRASGKVLLLCLSADAVLILIHVLHLYSGVASNAYYSISTDRGFAESFQYIKEGWIALMLMIIAIQTKGLLYACWAALFGLFAIDDLVAARESLGRIISVEFELDPLFGLRARDVAELVILAVVAALLVTPILLGRRFGGPDARNFGRSMILVLVVFAGFAVVLDMISAIALPYPPWGRMVAMLEEGGELIVMSIIVGFVFRTWHERN